MSRLVLMLQSSGRKICSVLFLIAVFILPLVAADDQAILITSPGCSKCAATESVLENVLAEYPDRNMVVYEVYSEEGRDVIRKHQVKGGVPALVVGDTVIGYKDYQGDDALLEKMIQGALASDAEARSEEEGSGSSETISLSVMTSFVAGLLAGFNPCLFGILAFLATAVISSTGTRKDLFLMVICFSLGIFAMYYLFGVGMLHTLHAEVVAAKFKLVVTAVLLVLGLVHLEDARRLRNGFTSLFRARWSQKYIEGALSRGRLSSYFLLGALFSLVKAPCVGAVYIVILGIISDQSYSTGAVYLLFYNLGVILPVVILGGIIALGMSPDKIDRFRKDHRAGIRFVTGLTLLALAPLLYWQII
ncbi:MAG: cytochrome c biogenesis protein CcdA [Methanotrichaceae archaeon]